jgi:cardiolipin synthase A/B
LDALPRLTFLKKLSGLRPNRNPGSFRQKDCYQRNALLHAKTAVIDGVWSTVGSANMDLWSLLSDDEVNAIILSRGFAVEMEKMFDKDLSESDQIKNDEWRERPLLPKIGEWFAHLFAGWL